VIIMPPTDVRTALGRRPDIAKRAAIMAAAQRLFAERGFTATSMDAVARLAGTSKLTAYRHFGSKDELFAAAITARCEAMLPVADAPALAFADAEAALVAFGEAFLRLILHHDALAVHRLIISERERAPQLGPIFYDAAIVPTQLRLTALIVRLGLPVGDPQIAATDLLALWRGKPMLPVEMGLPHWDPAECHAHVARTVRLCLTGWPAAEVP
jgi:TetR/AcrR family transcriptional regulator, mexJK operon transcriptional repressor